MLNRRNFTRVTFGALSGIILGAASAQSAPAGRRARRTRHSAPHARQQTRLRVNGERLLATLKRLSDFGRNPEGGIDRLAYSDADFAARQYVVGLMRDAGLEVTVDFAANLVGRRDGTCTGLPPLALGSHIDSVPNGGSYDGPVGALAAVEVARTLAAAPVRTRHPLEILIFSNEEGGKTGSRALSGELEPPELDLVTASGKTIRDGIRFLGGDPDRLDQLRRRPGDVAAYLELHIEQGAVLEREGIPIGVVEGIVGIKRWNATVEGFANHAGTTPMDARRDALVAAARFITAVPRLVKGMPGRQVATVGRIQAHPGAPNVIPGRVTFSLEIRDLEMAKIDRIFTRLEAESRAIGRETGTAFAFDHFYTSTAAPTDERLRRLVEQAAAAEGLATLRMPSGAGHDAQSIAQFAPTGMIFIPSVGGISHSPQEFSRPDHIVAGANVLLHAVLAADAAFDAD